MPKAVIEGFGRSNADLQPPDPSPEISGNVQQSLDRLLVYDYTAKMFRLAAGDIDGRLIISMSGVQVNNAVYGFMPIAVGAFLLKAANPNRRQILFFNNTGAIVYLGFNGLVTAANGFVFAPGAVYSDNLYTGEYWAFQALPNGDIRYMEF